MTSPRNPKNPQKILEYFIKKLHNLSMTYPRIPKNPQESLKIPSKTFKIFKKLEIFSIILKIFTKSSPNLQIPFNDS